MQAPPRTLTVLSVAMRFQHYQSLTDAYILVNLSP